MRLEPSEPEQRNDTESGEECRSSQQSEFHEDLLLENLVGLKRWYLIMPKRRELIPATLG